MPYMLTIHETTILLNVQSTHYMITKLHCFKDLEIKYNPAHITNSWSYLETSAQDSVLYLTHFT